MKKLLLSILFLSVASALFAQTERGRMGIYGSLSARYSEVNLADPDFYLSLSPSFLIFIADNLAINPAINFYYDGWEGGHSYGAGTSIGVQYYFGEAQLKPFVSAVMGYSTNKSFSTFASPFSSDNISVGGAVGVAYFINNSVGVTASLNYTKFIVHHPGNSNFLQNSINFGIGMTYILPK